MPSCSRRRRGHACEECCGGEGGAAGGREEGCDRLRGGGEESNTPGVNLPLAGGHLQGDRRVGSAAVERGGGAEDCEECCTRLRGGVGG